MIARDMDKIRKKRLIWRILDVRSDKDRLISVKEEIDSLIHTFLVSIYCISPLDSVFIIFH